MSTVLTLPKTNTAPENIPSPSNTTSRPTIDFQGLCYFQGG